MEKKIMFWGLSEFFTPFCDLCLRLHLDSKPNVIDNMHAWWFYGACKKSTSASMINGSF